MKGGRREGISISYPRTLDGHRLDVVAPPGIVIALAVFFLTIVFMVHGSR